MTLAGVVASTVAFASFDKSVDLVVDGRHQNVHAFGDSVQDVLSSEGVRVGGHDIVSPAPNAKIKDGTQVVVRYGRQLTVTIDGRDRQYWTTALNVDEALAQLGLRADSARLSVSRSLPLGRRGLSMDLDTRKDVALVVGGKAGQHITYASTVGELLDEAAGEAARAGQAVRAADHPARRRRHRQARPGDPEEGRRDRRAEVRHQVDRSRPRWRRAPPRSPPRARPAGQGHLPDHVRERQGQQPARWSRARCVAKPVTQVEQVGTKKPAAGPIPTGSGGGLNWAALAKCESGGNPRAVNPAGYYGLYQFSLTTWHSVGGAGNPIDASASEQTARAQALYARGGSGQWGCGSHLYD